MLRARIPGRFAHEGTDVAVGDWIALSGDSVDSVLPRRSAIVRNAAGRATRVQTLVANVDVAFVVSSLGPELEPRRIERYLVTIWESGASPEIVLTKADRVDDRSAYLEEVEAVANGAPVHLVSARTGEGCDELRARIAPGVTAVLLGSSGVGKSTLVNRFVGSERMARARRARTTTRAGTRRRIARLILLPGGGIVIDTPGLRELQLAETAAGLDASVRRCRGARRDLPLQRLLAQRRARLRRPRRGRGRVARRPSGSKAGASSSASCIRLRSARTTCCARRRPAAGSSSAARRERARGLAEAGRRRRGGAESPGSTMTKVLAATVAAGLGFTLALVPPATVSRPTTTTSQVAPRSRGSRLPCAHGGSTTVPSTRSTAPARGPLSARSSSARGCLSTASPAVRRARRSGLSGRPLRRAAGAAAGLRSAGTCRCCSSRLTRGGRLPLAGRRLLRPGDGDGAPALAAGPGLVADGVAGPETLAGLGDSAVPSVATPRATPKPPATDVHGEAGRLADGHRRPLRHDAAGDRASQRARSISGAADRDEADAADRGGGLDARDDRRLCIRGARPRRQLGRTLRRRPGARARARLDGVGLPDEPHLRRGGVGRDADHPVGLELRRGRR